MKNILGIQWGDTATVSAIKDREVVSAIAEERFTRKKNDMSFPIQSINFCKKSLNNKVDLIAIASKQFDYLTTLTHFYSIPTQEMLKIQDEYYYPLFYQNKKKNFIRILKKHWKTNQYPKEYWSKVNKKKVTSFSDDVTGFGLYTENGYFKGKIEVASLPEAEFKVRGQSNSAHSGGITYSVQEYNSIQEIKARSINPVKDTEIEAIVLG